MIAIVDMERLQILEVDGRKLEGECNQCGVCCQQQVPFPGKDGACIYLVMETVDDKPKGRCEVYRERPAVCALWPMPEEELPEECGFSWAR